MSEVDFIIVGGGAGSMCAALELRKAGKSVLILEKTELFGGTTATAGGVMWIPNNRYMKEEDIPDSREAAIQYLDATVGKDDNAPGATAERRERYVDEAPALIDFLVEQGLQFRRVPSWPDYYDAPGASVPGRTVVSELFNTRQIDKDWQDKLRPGFLPIPAYLEEAMQIPYVKRTWAAKKVFLRMIGRTLKSRLSGKNLATAGQALQAQLLRAGLNAGVDIKLNTGVSELLTEADRVIGVKAKDGKEYRAALGVLINAGGFAHNQAMLDKYIPGISEQWSNTIKADTGDLIQAGQAIGAAVAQMEQRIGSPCALPPNNPDIKPGMQGDMSQPHSMVVDQTGERYMCEASSYAEIAKSMMARNESAPAIHSWMIFDSQYIENAMLAGSMPGKKKPKEWFDEGFLLQADSIADLAEKCELPVETLQTSVQRFNGFVANNKDEDFGRGGNAYSEWLGDELHQPSHTLGEISEGPFYAIKIYPGDVSTYGGLLTDGEARVLREDGSTIDGLYATGTSTASVFGSHAPGAGAGIGPAMVWAWVAAKHALSQH